MSAEIASASSSSSAAADGSVPAAANVSPAVSSGILCINGCGRMSNKAHTCPVCLGLKITGAQFCSPTCYRENYKTHKEKYHPKATPAKEYQFPEGTRDAFRLKFPNFKYSGSLRAVEPIVPVPKREVPKSITYPDYANNCENLDSIPTRWSQTRGGQVFGKAEEVYKTIKWGLSETITNSKQRFGKVLNKDEIEGMRKVCKIGREVLDIAAAAIKPGVTTLEIDRIVHEECLKREAYPSPLNYHRFPRSVCTSINETICHGIPDARPLEDGDIINLDVSVYYGGFHGDLNATYPVGAKVTQEHLKLIEVTRRCLDEAIRICKPGVEFRQVGHVIEPIATAAGFSVNRTYVGHGINQLFHTVPNISHYANNRDSGRMKVGQTFTIEPMICVGREKAMHWPDNWTATTTDGKFSAQFEETLLITEDGCEVLTAAPGWTLPPPPESNGHVNGESVNASA
ncbi:Methionine aminopeptidase 1 [Microbotryomycetes sp. JL201]|nr:Methionine aminopeptidase 1 [Microbotryomycetes sp. JL201]